MLNVNLYGASLPSALMNCVLGTCVLWEKKCFSKCPKPTVLWEAWSACCGSEFIIIGSTTVRLFILYVLYLFVQAEKAGADSVRT